MTDIFRSAEYARKKQAIKDGTQKMAEDITGGPDEITHTYGASQVSQILEDSKRVNQLLREMIEKGEVDGQPFIPEWPHPELNNLNLVLNPFETAVALTCPMFSVPPRLFVSSSANFDDWTPDPTAGCAEINTFIAPSKGHDFPDYDFNHPDPFFDRQCAKCGMTNLEFFTNKHPICPHADNPPHQWMDVRITDHVGGGFCVNCGEMVREGAIMDYGPCPDGDEC